LPTLLQTLEALGCAQAVAVEGAAAWRGWAFSGSSKADLNVTAKRYRNLLKDPSEKCDSTQACHPSGVWARLL